MTSNQNHLVQASNLNQGSSFLRDTATNLGATGLSSISEEGGSEASAAEEIACPELAIIQAAQKAGNLINDVMTGISNYHTNFDYIQTLTTGHGIGLTESATNKASTEYANSSITSMGGKIGAMFGGPLGALVGRGIAGLFEDKPVDAIAYSPTGSFNPQSGNTPQNQEAPLQLQQSSGKPYSFPQSSSVLFLNGPGPSFAEINLIPSNVSQDLYSESHVPDDSSSQVNQTAMSTDTSNVSFLDNSGPDFNSLSGAADSSGLNS